MSYSFQEPDPHAFQVECAARCDREVSETYRGKPWCGNRECAREIDRDHWRAYCEEQRWIPPRGV